MVKPRKLETDAGIQGELNTQAYDRMIRRMRDKSWLETGLLVNTGIGEGPL